MGFNRRKMKADRKAKADAEAATRRATDAQVFADAERLIDAWNERQARRMPNRRSAPRSQRAINSCGCAAPPAEPSKTLTYESSIAIATLRSRV